MPSQPPPPENAGGAGPEDEALLKAMLCQRLSAMFGNVISILRILKVAGSEPTYHLELDGCTVILGNVNQLIDQGRLRTRVAEQTEKMIPRLTRREWDPVARMLLEAVTICPGGAEADYKGRARMLLEDYLRGENRISRKQAELERDRFVSSVNRPTPAAASTPLILFGRLAELYLKNHVEVDSKISASTRQKCRNHIHNHILPRWRDVRLADLRPLEVEEWLRSLDRSWWMMVDLRNIMSAIFTQAQAWGYWPEDRRNPMSKVNLGRKREARPKRILTDQETNRVLARLQEPNRLIAEIALSNGGRRPARGFRLRAQRRQRQAPMGLRRADGG